MIPFGASLAVATEPSLMAAVLLVLLFSASFFFSGTETALFSLEKVDRSWFARQGRTGKQVSALLERKREELISTILMGNETANVAITTLMAGLVAWWVPDKVWWVNPLLASTLLILLSEFTPKTLAKRFKRRWSTLAVWPLTVVFFAIWPLRLVLGRIVATLARPFGEAQVTDEQNLHEEELRRSIARSDEIDETERNAISAVLEFDRHTVERLMTPRPDIFSVPMNMSWNDLLRACKDAGRSRIPVYGERPDDLIGVLLLKDLLKVRLMGLGPRQLRTLLLPPMFVPGSKKARALLRQFLARKSHMAFVVDEHGTLIGLVTLDDLLDELIGEIEDDEATGEISSLPLGYLAVQAGIDIEDFEEETGLSLPEGDYHTLSGFIFHQLGRLPRRGDTVQYGGRVFVVRRMEGRRIQEVVVRPLQPGTQEAV